MRKSCSDSATTLRWLLPWACWLLPLTGTAQPTTPEPAPASAKYWIYFTDKPAASSPTPAADDPAAQRRSLRGTATSLDILASVNDAYLHRLSTLGIQPVTTSRWLNAVSAYLNDDQRLQVENLPFVATVRPVARLSTPQAPADASGTIHTATLLDATPDTIPPYGLSYTQLQTMNAVAPLERGLNGTGVRIGFLDTAFNFEHPAFEHLNQDGRLIEVRDFTGLEQTNLHGQNVASIAVGYAEDELVGPCHGADVYAATTEYAPSETNQEEDNLVAGLEWMESEGVDVVNISLGYDVFDADQRSYTYDDLDGNTAVTTRAVDIAASLGMVVVVSAGNGGGCGDPEAPGCWYYIGTPADADSAITVGAVTPDSARSSFSSFGPTADGRIKPDVSAQGSQIRYATGPFGYSSGNGTSFSSPLVAGVVCQILQANPGLTPIEVRDFLRSTAHQADAPDNALGWGIINADAAIQQAVSVAANPLPGAPTAYRLAPAYPNPTRGTTTLTFEAPSSTHRITLHVYDLLGRRMAVPFDGHPAVGENKIALDASEWSPGVYLYRLDGPTVSLTGKLVVSH